MKRNVKTYEPWSNRRLDKLLLDKGDIVERLGEVFTYREKVLVRCKVCGFEWSANPQTLERSGCPKCYLKFKVGARKKSKYTLEEVQDILRLNGYKLDDKSNYTNNKTVLELIDIETGQVVHLNLRSLLGRKGAINPYKGLHPNEAEGILQKNTDDIVDK